MNELIAEAAKIKSAQLKSRAGRQPWESAPLWFKSTSHLPPELVALREKGLVDRLDMSMRLKEGGNEALTQLRDPQEAIDRYIQAIGLFLWFERRGKKGEVLEDCPLVCSLRGNTDIDDEEERALTLQATAHVASCFSNVALCLLKLTRGANEGSGVEERNTHELAEGALFACNKALEFDPYNVRALFRRSEVRSLLPGSGFVELEASVLDLEAALKLEPGNAQVRSSLAAKREELRELKKKSKAALSGLFDNREGSTRLYSNGKGAEKAATEVLNRLRDVRRATGAGGPEKKGVRTKGHRDGGLLSTFSYVPWWGWMLIMLHMAYRIYHIWMASMRPKPDDRDFDLYAIYRSRLASSGHDQEL
jgi:tetratricopeptide (TPR) repeat protein